MKFLVISKINTNAPVPPPEQMSALFRAAKAWMADLDKKQVECSYAVLPNSAGINTVAVANAETAEEAMSKLMTYPLFMSTTFEVYPLADPNQTIDAWIEMVERALVHA